MNLFIPDLLQHITEVEENTIRIIVTKDNISLINKVKTTTLNSFKTNNVIKTTRIRETIFCTYLFIIPPSDCKIFTIRL